MVRLSMKSTHTFQANLSSTAPGHSMMDPTDRKFIKARPLAARLGLSSRTIFRWADAGHFHRFKVNERVVLFDESEVLAFVQASRVGLRRG